MKIFFFDTLENLKYPGRKRILKSICEKGTNFIVRGKIKIIGGQFIHIGNNFYAGPECRIEAWERYNDKRFSPKITIGNGVRINSKCHIGAINCIQIGNNVLFGSNVFITDHSHGRCIEAENDIAPSDRDLFSKGPVVIEDNVWLCENVIILPGVHVGRGCIIGAGAVVTKDVPPYSVVVGNPAKVVKQIGG